MMKNLALHICLLLGTSATAQISANYTPMKGPYGGEIKDMVTNKDGDLVAAVSGAGLFRSTNGGDSWFSANIGLTTSDIGDLEIEPVSGKLYALGGASNLFTSVDGGQNWVKSIVNFESSVSKVKRSKSYLFVIGDYGQVYRSVDDGGKWSSVGTFSGYCYDAKVNGSGHLYIATDNGVFRSINNGLSFTNLGNDQGIDDLNVISITISGTSLYALTSSGILKSTNNGDTWVSAAGDYTDDFGYGGRVEVDPSGSVYMFIDGKSSFNKSNNGGSNWQSINSPLLSDVGAGTYYSSVVLSSASVFYLGLGNVGLSKTLDGGINWSQANNGITGLRPMDFIRTDNGNLLYAAELPSGYYISLDGGESWDLVNQDATADRQINGFVKLEADTYLAYGDGILKTTDNGLTWTLISSDYFNTILVQDSELLYSYERDDYNGVINLLTSSDGGENWDRGAISGIPSPDDMYIGYGAPHFFVEHASIYFWIYNDFYSEDEIYKLDPTTYEAELVTGYYSDNINNFQAKKGVLYVFGDDGVLHVSADTAQTWTDKTLPSKKGKVYVMDSLTLFLLLDREVYLSLDGGINWANQGSVEVNQSVVKVDISDDNHAYITVDKGVVYKSIKAIIHPLAPTKLAVIGYTDTRVALSFLDNSVNEKHFIIEKSTDDLSYDSIAFIQRPDENVQKRVDYIVSTGLAPNTSYFFRVRATNAAGRSAYTNIIQVKTQPTCVPTIPDNHTWTANDGGYGLENILIKRQPNGSYYVENITAGGCSDFQYDVEGYFFENCGSTFIDFNEADAPNGNGTWNAETKTLTLKWQTRNYIDSCSGFTTFTLNSIDPEPESVPNLLTYPLNKSTVLLQWTGSRYEQQYIVERASSVDENFKEIALVDYVNDGATWKYYKDPTVTTGVTYYYRIYAANGTKDETGRYTTLSYFPSDESSVETFENTLFDPIDNVIFHSNSFGNGGSWGDVDGDGIDDLILAARDSLQQRMRPLVFKSKGDGQFSILTIPDAEVDEYSNVNIIDANNDGLNDIFLEKSSLNSSSVLLTKKAEGGYSKVLFNEFGKSSSSNSAWADYDNDGDLDLLTLPQSSDTYSPKLFRNNGDNVFTEIKNGNLASDDFYYSTDAQWVDYDNDGDQDLFLPGYPSQLYENNGKGNLARIAGSYFESNYVSGETASWGDYNNDGNLDVFVGGNSGSVLVKNNGDRTFTKALGTDFEEVSNINGSGFGDIDNDGDLDLLLTSYFTNAIYHNNGEGGFQKYTGNELFTIPSIWLAHGVPLCDADRDGFLDFYVGSETGNTGVPNYVLRNISGASPSKNWIQIRLQGTTSNRSAVGARVKITAGGKTQIREVQSHSSNHSQNSMVVHVGIGSATSITRLEIDWPSTSVIQTLNNPSINQVITIVEDVAGPVASILSPVNGTTAVSTATAVGLELNEASSPVAGKKLSLYANNNPTVALFTFDVTSAEVNGNQHTFLLPSKLAVNTEYFISVDAGAFVDIYNNASPALSASAWTFKTAPAPVAVLFAPANGSSAVALSANLEVTFDQPVATVASRKVYIYSVANTSMPIETMDAGVGVIDGNKIMFNPASDLISLGSYHVVIEAGAITDLGKNDFPGIVSGVWGFTTIDNVAPLFGANNNPTTLNKTFSPDPAIYAASVSDNSGTVSSVSLHYRSISSKTFTELAGTLNPATKNWDFPVRSSFFDDTGIQYYFVAKDPVGNTGRLPLADNTYFSTRLKYSSGDLPTIDLVKGDFSSSGYQIISIPFILKNADIASNFEELGSRDKAKYRFLRYRGVPSQGWEEYPGALTNLERGAGYFINLVEDVPKITLLEGVGPKETRDSLFVLNLTKGWNQIGNPYLTPIRWADVIAYNNITSEISTTLLTYSNGFVKATGAGRIEPFKGGFVQVENDINVKIPFQGDGGTGRVNIASFDEDLSAESWEVEFELAQGSIENKLTAIGMTPKASLTKDIFDLPNPPRLSDFIEMRSSHPEHFLKDFVRDVVPTQSAYMWNFHVTSNLKGMATLKWNPGNFGNNSKELYLFDVDLQKPIDMRIHNTYRFDPKRSREFKIYFGEHVGSKIRPTKIVSDVYPNPSNGLTNITFTLPDSRNSYLVKLEIFDILGNKIGSVAEGSFVPGFHAVEWDSSNKTIGNGIYIYRLLVRDGDRDELLKGKIILQK